MERFPVRDRVFETPGGRWAANVLNDPEPGSSLSPYPDMVLFEIEFKRADEESPEVRHLRLWTSHSRLCSDADYQALLLDCVFKWLSMSQAISGEIWLLHSNCIPRDTLQAGPVL